LLSKEKIKLIKSLDQQKFRQKYNKFTAEGEKTVIELLLNGRFKAEAVYTSSQTLLQYLAQNNFEHITHFVEESEIRQISFFKNPSPVVALFEKPTEPPVSALVNKNKIIYLDDVQDPGNVGTILRAADWFGIDAVIRSAGSADFFNPKTIQSSMGSISNLVIGTSSLSNLHNELVEHVILGTFMEGTSVYDIKLPQKGILVIGHEGKGIPPDHAHLCTEKINIPGVKSKLAESLNAAVACSIVASFWAR
jgi:TrmH family RNA methyltransferase